MFKFKDGNLGVHYTVPCMMKGCRNRGSVAGLIKSTIVAVRTMCDPCVCKFKTYDSKYMAKAIAGKDMPAVASCCHQGQLCVHYAVGGKHVRRS